jgi:mannose-1-phosphate guanylyltransferase/mannose-6-phosphate isomerase
VKAVVLAGGSGQRLWPISRERYPKQFLSINTKKSLLQATVERISRHMDDVLVVTNKDQYFHVRYQLEDIGLRDENILTEPIGKNTAPAIALASTYIKENFSDDNVLILPSDHILSEGFFKTVDDAKGLAEDYIVTFGIAPTSPATGYGYIKYSTAIGPGFKVKRFTEKPSLKKAKEFLQDGHYLWNSGIFLFQNSLMGEEFRTHLPVVHRYMASPKTLLENYRNLPAISIDYGIIEKSSRVAVMPFKGAWHDVGSWKSIYDILQKDGAGNAIHGDVVNIDTENSLIFGGDRLIATIGLDNIAIVDTKDALLVAGKSRTEEVKTVIEELKKEKRPEYREGTTVYKPWGYYTVLEDGERYKVKRLCIYPGKGISHQMHQHRAEHWIVVRGTAKVTKGDEVLFVHENESIYVPKSTAHRLENSGKVSLHIIETQTGEYLEEDDIIRFKDDFGRS